MSIKHEPPRKRPELTRRKKTLFALVLVFLALGGFWFWYEQYKYETTDDAYVRANSTQLAPEVAGIVTHVLVSENEKVTKGQILVQLDPKDYLATLASARSDLGALEAQLKSAEADFRRSTELLRSRTISQQAYDHARAAYQDLQLRVEAAQARVEQARLDVEYTSLRAPSDGQIARKSVQVGMYAGAGTALLGFVPLSDRWVDANFKETQLSSIVVGRPAKVTIDALPGREYRGIVESISPATGATFTLLPPDNATGNFTKVTQRVPVRIHLTNLSQKDTEMLRDGLSANVEVLKREKTEPLPPPAAPVFISEQLYPPAPASAVAGTNLEPVR